MIRICPADFDCLEKVATTTPSRPRCKYDAPPFVNSSAQLGRARGGAQVDWPTNGFKGLVFSGSSSEPFLAFLVCLRENAEEDRLALDYTTPRQHSCMFNPWARYNALRRVVAMASSQPKQTPIASYQPRSAEELCFPPRLFDPRGIASLMKPVVTASRHDPPSAARCAHLSRNAQ